jgi:outer membrane protein
MKNFTLGLNIVLIIAVAVLFYLHFSSEKKRVPSAVTGNQSAGNFRIAYFEIDSVQNQFELLKEVHNSLNAKDQELSRQLSQLENDFAKKYQDLQKNGSSLSQAEVISRQQELEDMDKNLKIKKRMMESEMQDESFNKLQDVKKKIENFLKDYNKNKGYSYILANSSDMNMMYYKDTIYNITADVIKGLNELYKNKK